jgi:hypothetical protein
MSAVTAVMRPFTGAYGDTNPLRVISRVYITDIPRSSNLQARAYRLGRDFCSQMLQQPFNNNLQDEYHDSSELRFREAGERVVYL